MTHSFRRLGLAVRFLTVLGIAFITSTACEDFSSVDYQPTSDDAGSVEASDPDSARANACRACITDEGAPCRGGYDKCTTDSRCKEVMDCILAADCMRQVKPENQAGSALPQCALDCLEQAGTNINELLGTVVPLFMCVTTPGNCREVCFDI